MKSKIGLSVLVVEDSEDLAELAAMVLGSRGHRIFKALSGTQGVQLLQQEDIDVVLLDLTLPDMQPEDFVARLKATAKNADIHLVLVSGRADIQEWAGRFGQVPCLKKPYDFHSLINTVESTPDLARQLPQQR
jgi:CheY-like chemotaxis protein